MRVLALLSVATAFRTPAVRFARAPPVQAALDVDGIKNAIAPSEIGASSQAIYSWGGLALGSCQRPTVLRAAARRSTLPTRVVRRNTAVPFFPVRTRIRS